MIIFIHGNDSHLVQRKVEEVQKGFIEKFDPQRMNVDVIDVATNEEIAFQALSAPPFLAPKRLIVMRGILEASNAKPYASVWIDRLIEPREDRIVVIVSALESAKARKHKIFDGLHSENHVHEYAMDALDDRALYAWISQRLAEKDIQLSSEMITSLQRRCRSNMAHILLEIEKLAASPAPITQEIFDLLIPEVSDDQIFAVIDAVQAGNAKRALDLLKKQREFGTANFQLLSMLIRQIRLLRKVKLFDRDGSGNAAKALGIHPFVVKKISAAASKLSMDDINNLIHDIILIEERLKTGSVRDGIAADSVILSLMDA